MPGSHRESDCETFRFAPSPNGYLHLGHAYSAFLNVDLARQSGGRFLLRIEDIDTTRALPRFEQAIYEDLFWLGLEWETPVRRQSAHFADYAAALERLEEIGVLYACNCRRSDIAGFAASKPDWPRDPDGAPLYPGICRHKSKRPAWKALASGGVALRLDMGKAVALAGQGLNWREQAALTRGGREGAAMFAVDAYRRVSADPMRWGDVVLARKDTPASYHIAVVVDDARQSVTNIVRGKDLFHATSIHRLLQRLLDLPEPRYRHHDLILDEAGGKLSKSAASTALRILRAKDWSPEDVRSRVGLASR